MTYEKNNRKVNANLEIIIIGVMLGLLLLSQTAARFYIKRGWSTIDTPIAAMAVDQDGNIWAADMENRLWILEGEQLASVETAQGTIPLPAEETITALTIDRQNRFWIGTSKGSVARSSENDKWEIYTLDETGNSPGIKEILIDGQGRAWVRTGNDLGLIDPAAGKYTYNFDTTGLPGAASDMAVDEQGQVWAIIPSYLGGNEDELKVLGMNGEWNSFTGLKEDWMGGFLVVDRLGQVWFGPQYPDGKEIRILDQHGTITTRTPGDYPDGSEFEQFDERGWLWVANSGVHVMKPGGSWIHYESRTSGLPWGGIMGFAMDNQGFAWALVRSQDQNKLTRFNSEAASAPFDRMAIARVLIIVLISIVALALISAWMLNWRKPGFVRFEIVRDFSIGLLGWFGAISLYWFSSRLAGMLAFLCIFIPLIPSVIGGILLYRKRRWMALGALAAFVVNSIGLIVMPPSTAATSYPTFILGFIPYFY